MFLGRLTPRKRLDVLTRAFALLRRSDALSLSPATTWEAAPCALARALGVRTPDDIRRPFSGSARIEALADADVLVYPSQDEIFGLVPLEAMLSGTPVIVADDSGCGEVIGATGGGQVVSLGSPSDLAQSIERVLDAPGEWRAAAARAAIQYGPATVDEIVCAELERMYRGMVA